MTFNQYNGFNQLIKTTEGDKTIDYTYNGDGLRTSKTVNDVTTIHIWDGAQIVLELDGAGSVTGKYVRGINLLYAEDGTGTNRKWYLFNGHGDVVQLTGTDGNVTKTYDYDAFGNEKDPDPNDTNVFRYCGEYFDKETGTLYLRARYYDAGIGRFISEDSYWGEDNSPLSLNLYTYCADNPVMYIDPSGNFFFIPALIATAPAWAPYVAIGAAAVLSAFTVDYIVDNTKKPKYYELESAKPQPPLPQPPKIPDFRNLIRAIRIAKTVSELNNAKNDLKNAVKQFQKTIYNMSSGDRVATVLEQAKTVAESYGGKKRQILVN